MPTLLLADAATESLGGYGALANLTCLAFVLVLAGYETLVARTRREDKQQGHLERLAEAFRAETREQRAVQKEIIDAIRADALLQRQESARLADRNTDAISGLASAVHSLRLDLHSHASE